MKVVVEITPFEARCFHNLIHEGIMPDKEWIDPEWIKSSPDKRTALEAIGVIYESDSGLFHLTHFGVKLRTAFGNWQPATDLEFNGHRLAEIISNQ